MYNTVEQIIGRNKDQNSSMHQLFINKQRIAKGFLLSLMKVTKTHKTFMLLANLKKKRARGLKKQRTRRKGCPDTRQHNEVERINTKTTMRIRSAEKLKRIYKKGQELKQYLCSSN